MFYNHTEGGFITMLPGISRKNLVHGNNTLLCRFSLEKGSVLPRHRHVHEQTGFLVSGRMSLTIGGETFDVGPGDSWCVLPNVEHGAEILEDSVAIEVFSPVRDDYLSG